MFVPIFSTFLLLDVSVSYTSNSSTVQHENPIVVIGHLNALLPPTNSSLTATEGELESYDDSEQDNVDVVASGGEARMFSFFKKPPFQYTQLVSKEAKIELQPTIFANVMALLEIEKRNPKQNQNLLEILTKLLGSKDEELKSLAGSTVFNLLNNPETRVEIQDQFLVSQTKLSTIFTFLMVHTEDKSLNEFFELELHIPLLSYACKLYDQKGIVTKVPTAVVNDVVCDVADDVAEDVARLLTQNHKGGNLITWLGTYRAIPIKSTKPIPTSIDDYINRLVDGLLRNEKTRELAYRLHALSFPDLVSFHSHYSKFSILTAFDLWLKFAAFTRFNYIEHEAKSSEFSKRQIFNYMEQRRGKNREEQMNIFSFDGKLQSTIISLKSEIDWLQLNDDQIRLFRAALQSEYHAKLVRESLKEKSHVAAYKKKLGDENMVKTFEALLNDEKFVELLQKVLKDEYLVQILKEALQLKHPRYRISGLRKRHAKLKLIEADVNDNLQMLVTDHDKAKLIIASLAGDVDLKLFGKAFEAARRLKLVEDMLSSTELDTMKTLEAIFTDQTKVQLLREAVKDDEHLKKFRLILDDTNSFLDDRRALVDENLADVFDNLLKDMNHVFFLRVAIKDDDRVSLFRAVLEGKEQVKKFGEALNKKSLVYVFRSILQEEKQLRWLEKAVLENSYQDCKAVMDSRDRMMLDKELFEHLESFAER
ncbi:hypothetical protein Plhal304r1_c066g0153701 [Plasmopara halstedii]